jgi:two-component system, cell cycle sensor histidine kinase and response regulator CckA
MPLCRIHPLRLGLRHLRRILGCGLILTVGAQAGEGTPAEDAFEVGRPLAQRYSIDQTGVIGRPRAICQLADGQIAVGTERGLFLYDGRRWVDVPRQSGVNSLAARPNGTLFLGGGAEIYELQPDGLGGFISFPRTDGVLRQWPGSIVSSLCVIGPTVYGLDGERLVVLPPAEPAFVVPLASPCDGLFEVGGQLYLRTQDLAEPLRLFDAVTRTIVPAPSILPTGLAERLVAHARDERARVWLATESGRFWITDGKSGSFFQGHLEGEPATRIHAIEPLPGGGLAVATVERGVQIFDASGRRMSRSLMLATGSAARVYALGSDSDGGLWLGGALELTRIDGWLRSSVYGEAEGLSGEVWAIVRHRGRLYVGTDTGLHVKSPLPGTVGETFRRVEGVPPVKSLLSTSAGLWITGQRLHLLLPDERLRTFGDAFIDANPILRLQRRPDVLLVGVDDGLRVLRLVARTWEDAGHVAGLSGQVFDLAEAANGDVWGSLGTGAVVRIRPRGERFEVQTFGEAEGIPNRWLHLGVLGDEIYLGADHRTLRWDEATGRFGPSTQMIYYGSDEPFGFDPVFSGADGSWVWSQTTIANLVPRPEPVSLAAMAVATGHLRARSRSVWYDDDGVVWVGLPAGLLRHRRMDTQIPARPAPVQIRRIVDLRTGRPILGGITGQGTLELPYGRNAFRVEAALPQFEGERFARFSIALHGYEEANESFSHQAQRDFMHLPPGNYELVVRARDGAGRPGVPVVLALQVRAPWYLTWPAYVSYGLVGVLVVVGLTRWRVAHLRRRAEQLQAAVDERTAEMARQSELLQEEKDLVASLATAAPVGIWHGDVRGQLQLVNAALERLCGKSSEELVREGWLASVHPEDRGTAEEMMKAASAGGVVRTAELRFCRPAGEVRWVLVGLAPVRPGALSCGGLVGTALDVTERREAERRTVRAQRLESVGTLTGGIAHDLNNALVPVIAGVSLLEEDGDPEKRAILSDIERSAKRAAAMVRQLLAFARGVDGQRIPVDLVALLRELTRIIARTFPKNIELRHEYREEPSWVQGDPTQLHQVLLNLCVNARDAMPQGGRLILRLSTLRVQGAVDAFHEPIPAGTYRVLRVEDTGSGIESDVLDKVFDPFFTTKELERGTGLGLSTTLGIVRSHGGFLVVETEVGRGTAFSVYLPATTAPAETVAEAPPPSAPDHDLTPSCGLVVDDEPTIRSVVLRTLGRMKIQGVEAYDGAHGLRVWQEHRERIGIAVIDLNMPVLDGLSMIRQLRPQAPQLPIIAFSGNLSEEQRRELLQLGVTTIVPKPFRFEQLADAVRQALQPLPPRSPGSRPPVVVPVP